MKTSLPFCVLALCLACVTSLHAATIRVNNQLTGNNVAAKIFISFNDAYAAAANGDTLMVEGSPKLYEVPGNAISIAKPLVIIGTGYFLKDNPNTQANHQESIFDFAVNFLAGSAGSVIQGIWFGGEKTGTTISIRTSNIIINRCLLPRALYIESENGSLITGIIISHNYLAGILSENENTRFSEVRVENNIISESLDINPTTNPSARTFSNVDFNTITSNAGWNYIDISATTFRNNIFYGYIRTLDVPVENITHNLLYGYGAAVNIGSINNNRTFDGTDGALFAGSLNDQVPKDSEYQLVNNSFKTMASDGREPGAFGGTNPYVLSGMPPIPAIYFLETPGTGSQQGGLPVTIRVKSN